MGKAELSQLGHHSKNRLTTLQGVWMNTKKFTILHSIDIHGDFLAEMRSGETARACA
jgi:hypothetical protein